MYLVTGATGFLGSHLTANLIMKGCKVRALKRKESKLESFYKIISYYNIERNMADSLIEWVDADILDILSLEEAMTGVEKVFHCAAFVSFNPIDKSKIFKINIKGTENVVNACLNLKVKKLCHVSSVAAFSRTSEQMVIDEKTEWKSSKENSNYAKAKYAAEREVWRGIEEGLNAVIVNPSIILGPGNWEKGSSKIFKTLSKLSNFYTEGVNGYVDVRDVAEIMYLLMESDISAERFIVSAENLSYKDIFTLILKNYGKKSPKYKLTKSILSIAWRAEYIRSFFFKNYPLITKETVLTSLNKYYYSSEKIINTLGFKFIPIEETIKFTAGIYLKEFKK
jgi:nucleoside-diphosphate-sugar epimerase